MTRDVVIVGGGIAGLAAAWRLRHRDVLLLEAGDRFGSRMRSDRRRDYWLNYDRALMDRFSRTGARLSGVSSTSSAVGSLANRTLGNPRWVDLGSLAAISAGAGSYHRLMFEKIRTVLRRALLLESPSPRSSSDCDVAVELRRIG